MVTVPLFQCLFVSSLVCVSITSGFVFHFKCICIKNEVAGDGEDLVADSFCVTHKKTRGSPEICVIVANCMKIVFLISFR